MNANSKPDDKENDLGWYANPGRFFPEGSALFSFRIF
jgi:hypothetical protein